MQKSHLLVCEGSLCPRKLPDVSGPGLGEAGRYTCSYPFILLTSLKLLLSLSHAFYSTLSTISPTPRALSSSLLLNLYELSPSIEGK